MKKYRIKILEDYHSKEINSKGLPGIWGEGMKQFFGKEVELNEIDFETDSPYITYSGFIFYKTDFILLEQKEVYPFPLYSMVKYLDKEYKVISSKFSLPTSNIIILCVPVGYAGWIITSSDCESYGIDISYKEGRCLFAEKEELILVNPFNHDAINQQLETIKSSPETIIKNRSILLQPITIKKRILI
jgi:hypothetical protein